MSDIRPTDKSKQGEPNDGARHTPRGPQPPESGPADRPTDEQSANEARTAGRAEIDHVSDALLAALVTGQLREDQIEPVERHLDGCDECYRRLQEAESADTFGQWLQDLGGKADTGQLPTWSHASQTPTALERAADRDASFGQYGDAARYELVGHHRRGGLGQVSLAVDRQFGREVAFKQIQPKYSGQSQYRERFLREAAVTARLEHPGIAPVYSQGLDERGQPYYAMRFISGETLGDAVRDFHAEAAGAADRFQGVAFRSLLNRFVSVCQTIQYAHQRGVLHRDIKPQNIMLGQYNETLVIDWGLAKLLSTDESATTENSTDDSPLPGAPLPQEDSRTAAGVRMGTAGFMSPEQEAGQAVGVASDIYSLGCVMQTLLIDQAAARGNKDETAPTQAAAPSWAGVPRPLRAICLRARAEAADQRYVSAAELAEDIERWLADEPVSCFRERWTTSVRRWARRHRVLVAAGVTAVAGGIVISLVAGELTRRSQQRENGLLVERHIKDAQLASSQGRLREALQILDRAATLEPHNQTVAVHRSELLDALGRSQESKEALENAKYKEGRTELAEAELLILSSPPEAQEHFRAAIQAGLSAADEHYARGMLADSTPEAIEQFRQAIDASPLPHRKALRAFAFSLLFSGRLDEAIDLAKHQQWLARGAADPFPAVIGGIAMSLQGDLDEGLETIALSQTELGAEVADELANVCRQLHRANQQLSQNPYGGNAGMLSMTSALRALAKLDAGAAATPILFRAYAPIPLALIGPRERLKEVLAQSAAMHPEALFHFLHAQVLAGEKRHAEAEQMYLQAVETPAFLPNLKLEALYGAAMSARAETYTRYQKKQPYKEPQRRAVDLFRRRMEAGPLAIQVQALHAYVTTYDAGEYELAAEIVRRQLRSQPDSGLWLFRRAHVDLALKNFAAALQGADRYLADHPSGEHLEAVRNLRDEAQKALRELVQTLTP